MTFHQFAMEITLHGLPNSLDQPASEQALGPPPACPSELHTCPVATRPLLLTLSLDAQSPVHLLASGPTSGGRDVRTLPTQVPRPQGQVLTGGLIVVDADALQLQIRVPHVVATGVDAVLITDDFPELQGRGRRASEQPHPRLGPTCLGPCNPQPMTRKTLRSHLSDRPLPA